MFTNKRFRIALTTILIFTFVFAPIAPAAQIWIQQVEAAPKDDKTNNGKTKVKEVKVKKQKETKDKSAKQSKQDKKVNKKTKQNNKAANKTTKQAAAKKNSTAATQPAYELISYTVPEDIKPHQRFSVELELKNTSNFNWGGKNQVKLASHWVDDNGQFEAWNGMRSGAVSLRAGDAKMFKFTVIAPEVPGDFSLQIDPLLKNKWFSKLGSDTHSIPVTVSGELLLNTQELSVTLNGGTKYTNDPKLELEYEPVPIPENLAGYPDIFNFIYAQASDANIAAVQSGIVDWGKWVESTDGQTVHVLQDQSVGWKEIFIRFRAFKKQLHNDGHTPDKFGPAKGYGWKSSATSDVYSVNPAKIFFDNVPPTGSVVINNGASTTPTRIGYVDIKATDTVDGVEGSGIKGFRYATDCNINNLSSSNWSKWNEFNEGVQQINKRLNNLNLGSGETMVVCAQVQDYAGNIANFRDSIVFYVPPPPPSGSVAGYSTIPQSGSGDYKDPYGGFDGRNNPWAELELDRHFPGDQNYVDQNKETDIKRAAKLTPPAITYAQTAEDASQVKLYGVAMPKGHPLHVSVWNEYKLDNCNVLQHCQTEWAFHYRQDTAQHVKVVFWEDTGNGWRYLGELWNDSADGRWDITFNLGGELNVGDKIVAETQVYGDYYFANLKWWYDTTENVNFNLSDIFWADRGVTHWGSGGSERVEVPLRWINDPALRAITWKEDSIGGAVREGGMVEWCGIKHINYSSLNGHGDSVIMYNATQDKAYLVSGDIWWSYYTNGGCGRFGAPTMDGTRTGGADGWYQNFSQASIYYGDTDPKTRPGIVEGQIRQHFNYWGGTWTYLRLPEGDQWGAVSKCGMQGTQQHFQGGKIFASYYGNYDIPYTTGWFDHHNSVGGVGTTGWPKGTPYNVGAFHNVWQFENGTLHWQNGNVWFEDTGCNNNVGRDNDPDNAAAEIIRRKEDQHFAVFKRKDGGTGAGAVHAWTCGGQTIWLVDYDEIITTYGARYGHSILMVNNGQAYLMNGPTLSYYFDNGGCKFGKPIADVRSDAYPTKHGNPKVDWQKFSNATLVHDWSGGTIRNYNYFAAIEYKMYTLMAEAGYDVDAPIVTAGLGVPGWGETSSNQHTVDVFGEINSIYANQVSNDMDATYIHGYLGIPKGPAHFIPEAHIGGQIIANVYGQEFQGGYILVQNGELIRVLNQSGMDLIQKDFGPTPLELLESFVGGFIEGAKSVFSIENATDVLGLALEIAGLFAFGPAALVVAAAELAFGLREVVSEWDAISSLAEFVFGGADPAAIWAIAGTIFGALLVGIVGNVSVSKLIDSALGSTKVLGKIADTLRSLENIVPTSQMDALKSLTKTTDDLVSLEAITVMLKRNPAIANKISGSLEGLTALEVKKIYQLAEKLDAVNVDEIAPMLNKMVGDLSKLSREQTEAMLVFVTKREKTLNADNVANWKVKGDLNDLTNGELDELVTVLDSGKPFDANDFRKFQTDYGFTVKLKSIYDETQSIAARSPYPSVRDRLGHVVYGNLGNPTSGLHYRGALEEFYKTRKIKVRYDGGAEITSLSELQSAISAGRQLNYMDVSKGSWNGNVKTLYKYDNISQIRMVGDYALANPGKVIEKNLNRSFTEIIYNGERIRLFYKSDSNFSELISWFPLY